MEKKPSKKLIISVVVVIVLGLWVAGSIALGLEYWNLKQKTEKNDAKAVVEKLKVLMTVPAEEPLVATITDAIKLKQSEPFYKNAQNGDKVVIWKDKAVIYRMDQNKIVDFGVVIRTQQPGVAGVATPSGEQENR